MKKNYFLLLFAIMCFAGKINAQEPKMLPCGTDFVHQQLILQHPEVLKYEAQLEEEIQRKLKGIDYSKAARTTTTDESGNPDFWYDIPIVIHIIHDYGAEYLTDDQLFNDFKDWNIVYSKQNDDTSSVIAPYKGVIISNPPSTVRYIGNPHIRLHLATRDPNGNPTKGITRHRSYITYTAGEQAKLDDWPPSSYVNIWSVNRIPSSGGFTAAAYALVPGGGAGDPAGDGILCDFDYMANSPTSSSVVGKTINHEMGHVFNLSHPWGSSLFPQTLLGDDNVDDTPPTWGHGNGASGCDYGPCSDDNSVYDTLYATNYYKVYPSAGGGDSVVNYPDTTNAQNIMDYTYCSRMFTNGQCARMHAAMNSDVAGRSNLWSLSNLVTVGILSPDSTLLPLPDYKPIPEFSATPVGGSTSMTNYKTRLNYFTFPNTNVKLHNETWNDTLTNLVWTFTNTAAQPTITQSSQTAIDTGVVNSFAEGGWVTMSMIATGNNTGDTTVTWPRAIFVADPVATSADGYVQSFAGSDTAKWPMFNYYNNQFKWQWANVGLYDNNSIEYTAFDPNVDPADNIFPQTGIPGGDVDDFFTVPFDLSSFSGTACYLNYDYSGGSRSSSSSGINDTMEIDYATKGAGGVMSAWTNLRIISKGDLDNKGLESASYTPSSAADWAPMATILPSGAKTSYTVFRFRYLPGNSVNSYGVYGGGNNFYMDRISFAQWPAYVNNVKMGNVDVALVPNPTNGDAYVVVKDADNTVAQIVVTDVTGKVVYKTSEQVTGNEARVLIPHSAISVQGMYIVQTITGNQTRTQKLVVE